MELRIENSLPDLSYARALVVDDMPTNLVMATGLLKKFKIPTDCVQSGREALEKIQRGISYSIIFMDHLMPGMDGMETLRQIRSLGTDYAKNVPIAAMTGEDSAGSEETFLKNGFQVFIPKPLSIAKLDTVLRNWIHA